MYVKIRFSIQVSQYLLLLFEKSYATLILIESFIAKEYSGYRAHLVYYPCLVVVGHSFIIVVSIVCQCMKGKDPERFHR